MRIVKEINKHSKKLFDGIQKQRMILQRFDKLLKRARRLSKGVKK